MFCFLLFASCCRASPVDDAREILEVCLSIIFLSSTCKAHHPPTEPTRRQRDEKSNQQEHHQNPSHPSGGHTLPTHCNGTMRRFLRVHHVLFIVGVVPLLQQQTGSGVFAASKSVGRGWVSSSSSSTRRLACLATPRRERRKAPPKKGFGTESPILASTPVPEATSSGGRQIYSRPGMYDLAFGYRSYEDEVDFLIGQHERLHNGRAPKRVLELAAGPARHTIAALQSGQVQMGIAVDTSPEMVEYGTETAQMELDIDSFESFRYIQDDMTKFQLPEKDSPIDSAWILLGSLQHLTENEQVISCFQAVHRAMSDGGSLIIELPHPRETFSLVECTRNGWEVPLEDENGEESGELAIIWGDDDDAFDPIKQVRHFTVAMELKEGPSGSTSPEMKSVREIVPMRHFTAQEIDALARIGGFKVESMFGALDKDVSVNDGLEAFRLVCVLQKV